MAYTDEPVLILKGEIPVMVLSQLNILSGAPTGGEASAAADYYPILSFSKQRIVIGDNDPDPEVRKRMQAFAESAPQLFSQPCAIHHLDTRISINGS